VKGKSWGKVKEVDLLYYAEFSDYLKIIAKEYNWKQAFRIYFPDRSGLTVKLNELAVIRNDIMHRGCVLTSRDRQRLKLHVEDILDVLEKTTKESWIRRRKHQTYCFGLPLVCPWVGMQ
jgi:hypothetical protein